MKSENLDIFRRNSYTQIKLFKSKQLNFRVWFQCQISANPEYEYPRNNPVFRQVFINSDNLIKRFLKYTRVNRKCPVIDSGIRRTTAGADKTYFEPPILHYRTPGIYYLYRRQIGYK